MVQFQPAPRGEARGVGGVFFDDLDDRPMEELFAFVSTMASTFVPAYCPIVTKNKACTLCRVGEGAECLVIKQNNLCFVLRLLKMFRIWACLGLITLRYLAY